MPSCRLETDAAESRVAMRKDIEISRAIGRYWMTVHVGCKVLCLKGTVAQDFLPTVFPIRSMYLPGPPIHTLIIFVFKFLELFDLKFDSPLHDAAGSKKNCQLGEFKNTILKGIEY